MAEQNVMRSFVMRLGFDVDRQQERKFDQSVKDRTGSVLNLKTAILGAATAAVTGFAKISDEMSKTNYQAEKLGADGVKNMNALVFATKQMGLNGDVARKSMQGLYSTLRSNPGMADQLSGLGVDPRDGEGNLRSGAKLLPELMDAVSKKPDFIAEQLLGRFDVNKELYHARDRNPDVWDKSVSGYNRRFEQDDRKGDADRATELMRAWNKLFSTALGKLKMLAGDFTEGQDLVSKLKSANEWLKKNNELINDTMDDIAETLGATSNAINEANKASKDAGNQVFEDYVKPAFMWMLSDEARQSVRDREDKAQAAGSDGDPGGSGKQKIAHWLKEQGFSPSGMAGVMANVEAESQYDPGATNEGHSGLFQWSDARADGIQKRTGIDVRNAGITEQMKAFQGELKRRNPDMLASLKRAGDASENARNISANFERPGGGRNGGHADNRADIANNLTVNVNVEGGGGDKADVERAARTGTQEALNRRDLLATRNGKGKAL